MDNIPATKQDLDDAMSATAEALKQTEQTLRAEINKAVSDSERRVIEAIDRLEKLYDFDRRLQAVEKKVGISAA